MKYCQQAMSNSPSQAEKSGTIIVIPNEQQRNQEPQRQEPQREAHRQCINTTFNTVWNDIHCQYNNPQFKWRTVYYSKSIQMLKYSVRLLMHYLRFKRITLPV